MSWNKKRVLNLIGVVFVSGFLIFAFIFNLINSKQKPIDSTETKIQETTEQVIIPIDFNGLWEMNDDVIGWIKIEGTNIDYPIMQSDPDMEEDYYLNTTPEGVAGFPGSIYIQKVNNKNFTDRYTAIYGHDLKDETMFSKLHLYYDRTFFDKYNRIIIYTPEKILEYQIFAVFKSDDESIMKKYENFRKSDRLQEFLDIVYAMEETDMNHFNKEITVTSKDKIVTLTTCVGDDNFRWRVVGVLVE